MKQLSIQIQTSPSQLAQTRRFAMRTIKEMEPHIMLWSDAGYRYTNVKVQTADPYAFWVSLKPKLASKNFKTIVTCQGNAGWDDFLLLDHFDKRQKLDRPPTAYK